MEKNINEELVSTLPDQLMNLCEDVELIDLKCAEVLGEKIKAVKYREKEQIENERKVDKPSNLEEFGKALGTKISSAFNEKKKTKPLSAEDVVKTVLNAVNDDNNEHDNDNGDNEFLNLSDKDVYINGEKPDKFFDKINKTKVDALKKFLSLDTNYLEKLEKLPLETQLKQLTQLHQKLKLKYIMYLQHLRPGIRLGKETHYLKERDISKYFQEIHDYNNTTGNKNNVNNNFNNLNNNLNNINSKVPTFEDYIKNFQTDKKDLELSEESNQDMLDRLFGDLDDMNTDLYVQIIRSMLLSSMLRSPEIEENFYKKRIHDLESLVKYIQKYEQPVPNQRIHLEPAVIKPEISMTKVLEADVPDFVLFRDLNDDNILQDMIKYYFHSDNKERINSFLAEMQEIERLAPLEPEIDHQFKILDDSYFQTHKLNST